MMNIRRWSRPETDEVRYYFDTKFGGAKWMTAQANRMLVGRWIGKADDGSGGHVARIFAKTIHGCGRCRTEDGPDLDSAFFFHKTLTWEEWESQYQACLTKGGNWSSKKYMKLD